MSTVVNEMVAVRCLVGGRDRVNQELDLAVIALTRSWIRARSAGLCPLFVVDSGLAEGANVGL